MLIKRLLLSSFLIVSLVTDAYANQDELMELSVEDLLNVEVISVSKKAKSLNDSPAAIYVISQDDIKRIGATSIPEALRLAPGLDVARIDSNKWAITSRGFNSRFANKLLVLIDGRNTYTRSFAGVYWENQDVMLEDVERIEVIRGPGATLWGANAVNGVINIITKHSSDTQGGLVAAGGGTEEQAFGAFRYGGEINEDTTARAYLKGFKRDENTHETGGEAGDDWDKIQGGFRIDSQITPRDSLTVQGDAYQSIVNQHTIMPQISLPHLINFNESIDTFGGNLLIKQKHTFSSTSDYSLQFYYDFYERDEVLRNEKRHTLDLDFQHRFAFLDWNDVIWGLGYRLSHDKFKFINTAVINQPSRNDQLFSAFIQDEITLIDDHLWLTLGSKFEHNDYSGFEAQPTAKLMWAPHHQHRLWASVSRAVRTPSRIEHDLTLMQRVFPAQTLPVPPFFIPPVALSFDGNPQHDSEQVISYEMGYRTTLIDNVSIDFTAFYNDYSNLRSVNMRTPAPTPKGTFPNIYLEQLVFFSNNNRGHTYGFEISTVWQMIDWWRWDANYSLLKTEFDGMDAESQIGHSPQQRVSLRSALTPMENVDLDLLFRYVDTNTPVSVFDVENINDYVSLDIRLAWRPVNSVELSVVGQNLLAEQHLEYKQEAFTTPTEIDRGMYGKIVWDF